MVLFLTGLVVVILMRTLRRDLARYDREADFRDYMVGFQLFFYLPFLALLLLFRTNQDRDMSDEYGWKQVHGDVFRPPPHLSWLSAFIGSGYQLAVVTILVILVTIAMDLYEE